MVIRRVVSVAPLLLVALSAQAPSSPPPSSPTPTSPPPAGTPAAAAPAAQDPAAQAPAALQFARVVVDKVQLRCWPGAVALPPVFEDVLVKDQVVAVGRSENGFRAIVLPLGPIGYVSSKFTTTRDDGRVFTKGAKVSFRYRPRSAGEPPVTQLADGSELHVIGEQDEWFKVRSPGVEAWVAEAEVQLAAAADPALGAAYETLRQQQAAEVQARLDQIAAAQARAKQDVVDLAAVQVVHDGFTAELRKPLGDQNYAPLTAALEQLTGTLAPESAGRSAIEALKKRIDTQRWIAEATAVRDAKPPQVDEKAPEKRDQLERFQSIGWLRYESRLAGAGVYFLEKGGQRQYLLSCDTGRYDLALFVGREVGVIGPRRRPATDSLSVLDVERLEVLGTTAR
ncbi:MAG: hypothetical protein MUC36_13705 [Planctomycetes bacterium]|jgi:hypothetical protein|nr:hypothetical protein [Planctomycetota bacterium]